MISSFYSQWRRKRNKRRKTLYEVELAERLARKSGLKSFSYICLIIIAHTFSMMYFEGFKAGDSLWLTLTSLTTVGYGDISASTGLGRLSTVLILYIGGIFVVGNMAGDFFDYRNLRREAMKNGNWSWTEMNNHIVIIGSKTDSEQHLKRLITECGKTPTTEDSEIVLISDSLDHGLPDSLQNLGVKYVKGRGNSPKMLGKAAITEAEFIIILAWEEGDPSSDGYCFDILSRVRETNTSAKIIAECVEDDNRNRLESAGATLVLRPVRAYPEMIIGGLINPGSTLILENLFTAEGERITRTDGIENGLWADIVSHHLKNDTGTAIAYRDSTSGQIITAPPGTSNISANALFLLGG